MRLKVLSHKLTFWKMFIKPNLRTTNTLVFYCLLMVKIVHIEINQSLKLVREAKLDKEKGQSVLLVDKR